MTAATFVEDSTLERGRHLPERGLSTRLARIRTANFAQICIAVFLLVLIWPASLGGSFGVVTIAGQSMEPTYELGDVVITWRQPVEVGDVVLFRVPAGEPGEGNPVIHRVIGGGPGGWETRGDNMPAPDIWRPSGREVLGVAAFEIPLDSRYLALLRSWWFVAAAAGLSVALVLWPDDTEGSTRLRGRHRPERGQSSRVGR